MLRPASQAGPIHEAAGVGKLVNSALLSLINEACVRAQTSTKAANHAKFVKLPPYLGVAQIPLKISGSKS